jgi:hypothetical protein
MRRAIFLVLSAIVALVAPLTMAPAQALTATITGTLLSASPGAPPLAGATVKLYTDASGAPGSVIDTVTTDSTGNFSLDAGSDPDYFIRVTRTDYQGGFVGGGFVQSSSTFYDTYAPGTAVGDVYMIPTFIRGYVVNPATGKRVSGVKVTARAYGAWTTPEAADVTNSNGVFVLRGFDCEDNCYLKFLGHPVDYENGYRACNGGVVATWGAACASPLGNIGKIRLQHL